MSDEPHKPEPPTDPVPKNEIRMWRLIALGTMAWPAVIGFAALFGKGGRMNGDGLFSLILLSVFLSPLAGAYIWRHAHKQTKGRYPGGGEVVLWFVLFLIGTIFLSPTMFFIGCVLVSG